jgi:hypothetical protein
MVIKVVNNSELNILLIQVELVYHHQPNEQEKRK